MISKAYQSKLIPYFEFIANSRHNRISWRSISSLLKSQHGVHAAPSTIYAFFCSYRDPKRRVPVGYPEDSPQTAKTALEAKHQVSDLEPRQECRRPTDLEKWKVETVTRSRQKTRHISTPTEEPFTTGPDIVS